ncbi:MAG: GNAT family N-acetyltransferase [Bacteroidetes bacterium]|nr:GNAT family N-acetyltransferase [Bacteroidota bacterium]
MSGVQQELKIRFATVDDVETIVDFNARMAFETEGIELDRHRLREGVQAVFDDETKGHYLLAEINGTVVGQLLITHEWSDWRNGVFWWIQSVYVEPAYRRRGVFTALYRFIEQRAKNDKHVCGLRLYVENSNTRGIATYSSLGMKMTHYNIMEVDFILKDRT